MPATRNGFKGLVFVPLLFSDPDVLKLPVHLLWHSLSLHYQQSVQGWGSWCWDWSTGGYFSDISFGMCSGPDPLRSNADEVRGAVALFCFPPVLILFGLMVISPLVINRCSTNSEPLNN